MRAADGEIPATGGNYSPERRRCVTNPHVAAANFNGLMFAPASCMLLAPTIDDGPLTAAPAPVMCYLRHVLPTDVRSIESVVVQQEGEFRLANNVWRPFQAEQHFTTDPVSFVWDAKIRLAPLLHVDVRDAYLDSKGSTRVSLLGCSFVRDSGKPEPNAAALQQFLAEAIWFPAALIPGHGVTWHAIDGQTALASIRDTQTSAALRFHFNEGGEVIKISTPARYRAVKGAYVPTPWIVRCGDYRGLGGFRVPSRAEVQWLLPEGPYTYWRGRIVGIRYRFASEASSIARR